MKLILVNTPIRSEPSDFPPVGITALLDALIKAGYEPKFYDIDALRPGFAEVQEFFRLEKPDILGISAVVSTAYEYTKKLAHAVKEISPGTKIIVGGCLAASAETLLRKCPIDLCVIGEGEKVLLNLVRHWEEFRDFRSREEALEGIKGIAFVNSKNEFIFTGFEKQVLPGELSQPNYDLLAEHSDINCYITDPLRYNMFAHDSRSHQPHRRGKKCCHVMTSKGCVSRCTFCHRWLKGYRSYPVDKVIRTMAGLKEKYNVGFFHLGAEAFGANIRVLRNFIDAVKDLDILFSIGGMRISTVHRNPDSIRSLKEVGCAQIIFGMESGSDKILTVMEKEVSRKENLEVARLVIKEGMYTSHQLVIGMPGENERTISDTIECVKKATEDMDDYPYRRLSITYFQALPGTPGYELMRELGLIGKSPDDEEKYLLKISDVDAASPSHYINVSEEVSSRVRLWPYKITIEATIHWYKRRRWKPLPGESSYFAWKPGEGLRGNLVRLWYFFRTTRIFFGAVAITGGLFWPAMLFLMRVKLYGMKEALLLTAGKKNEKSDNSFKISEPKSLRQFLSYPKPEELSVSEANMLPLRMGR